MIFLDMVENPVLQSPLLIREKISIGLKKHQENILMMRLSIFYWQTLLLQIIQKIYGLVRLLILEKEITLIG